VAILIKGGDLVDLKKGKVLPRDILVEDDQIIRIVPWGESGISGASVEIIDASGMMVFPGLIDMHVHLREPGQEHKEEISTGAQAAVAGGFTALACMPNTDPVNDSGEVTGFILERAWEAGLARVFPIAAVTKGQKGQSLSDFGELRSAGAVGISDDGFPVRDSGMMRLAMERAKEHGLVIISHCEDRSLSAGGVMHEGEISRRLGFKGIPAESEEIMVFREICLARLTKCPVHIAHVSTAGSVALIKRAKEEGLPVTAETAPHYFSLDHRAVEKMGSMAKMNPPLRRPEDVEAIKVGLSEDIIDVIATDHAPHSDLEKNVEFERAAFGIIGLETALPLVLALVREGVLSLQAAVYKLSRRPAELLGVEGGLLEEGKRADLTIVDPECEYVLTAADIQSKSKNTPFLNNSLKGRAILTMIGGRIVWRQETKNPDR